MEEILASIRRIISEDDAEPEDGQDVALEETDEAPPVAADEEAPVDEPPVDEPPIDEPEGDVLDLTDAIEDDFDMESTDESDIVEVTGDEEASEPGPDPFDAAPAPDASPSDDGLNSPPPASEATSQFSVLAAAVAGERLGQTMGVGARTIEDLVKEVMRPMIKEWLDANLPALVERLVGREIDRMARRAEDEIGD